MDNIINKTFFNNINVSNIEFINEDKLSYNKDIYELSDTILINTGEIKSLSNIVEVIYIYKNTEKEKTILYNDYYKWFDFFDINLDSFIFTDYENFLYIVNLKNKEINKIINIFILNYIDKIGDIKEVNDEYFFYFGNSKKEDVLNVKSKFKKIAY